jgi:hypothetical protein
LTLGVEAEKQDTEALQHNSVKVLDISVAAKWNSATIKEILTETANKIGHEPLYAISDNDSKLCKSFSEKACIHIRDVGHSMAKFIEQIYGKDQEFQQYTKKLSEVKIREVMRPSSYLLPPRQRTIARFMNLSPIIKWSKQMYENFSKLTAEEAKNFKFVKQYILLIDELEQIFHCVDSILKKAKILGFSKENIDSYVKELQNNLTHEGLRVKKVKSLLCNYLET